MRRRSTAKLIEAGDDAPSPVFVMKKLTAKGLTRLQMRGYSIVPLLTPFTQEGEVDLRSLEKIIEHIAAGGCQGLMVCGTTGEFASMTVEQRIALVREAVRIAQGRLLVFGGIGDTSLQHSVRLAREFLAAGADAVVGNLPSYYPLTPEMMERYFTSLADRIDGPVYLYNIPQTTRQSIPLDVIERLSRHPRIAGIKDSEPDGARQEQVCRMFAGRSDFVVFCGSIAFTSRACRRRWNGAGRGKFRSTARARTDGRAGQRRHRQGRCDAAADGHRECGVSKGPHDQPALLRPEGDHGNQGPVRPPYAAAVDRRHGCRGEPNPHAARGNWSVT
jgi:hypothetical protein